MFPDIVKNKVAADGYNTGSPPGTPQRDDSPGPPQRTPTDSAYLPAIRTDALCSDSGTRDVETGKSQSEAGKTESPSKESQGMLATAPEASRASVLGKAGEKVHRSRDNGSKRRGLKPDCPPA
jgi:hypothetical protein